ELVVAAGGHALDPLRELADALADRLERQLRPLPLLPDVRKSVVGVAVVLVVLSQRQHEPYVFSRNPRRDIRLSDGRAALLRAPAIVNPASRPTAAPQAVLCRFTTGPSPLCDISRPPALNLLPPGRCARSSSRSSATSSRFRASSSWACSTRRWCSSFPSASTS